MKNTFLLLLSLFTLCSCATVTDTVVESYEDAAELYESAIYDKTHDLEESGLDNANEEKLARLMTPVDGPLGSLVRYVSNRDSYPDEAWVEVLFARYPWINSLFITDQEGWMLDRYPYEPMKRIDEALHFEAVWRETFIQTRVDYPELGPELYLGTPMFRDGDFEGLIVVSFDPRTLFSFCPEPDQLIIIHPGGGVWTDNKAADHEVLMAVEWDEIIEDDVQGELTAGGQDYIWLVRYVGTEPYIYATTADEPIDSGLF